METKKYERPDSQQLLRRIQLEEEEKLKKTKGKLKIFLGYAAGSGKTYAMLTAAHEAKKHKIDVVAGYIEPHDRPDTQALVEGLETIAPMEVVYKGVKLREFNLDAALKRNPRLILVDELAHTNVKGCRNEKRYQDVKELLRAGIDVYTTMNVQHLESLERMSRKTVSSDNRNNNEFFTLEKLTALREIALRRCADRVNLLTENARLQSKSDYHTDEHILVCLSASPSNAKIIRTAARMAQAFHGAFTALFVETPDTNFMAEQDKVQLQKNIRLAQQLGASVETSHGDEVPAQIIEFARLSGVSQIVIGRSTVGKKRFFDKPTLTEKLIKSAPNLEIHVIPDTSTGDSYQEKKRRIKLDMMPISDIIKSIAGKSHSRILVVLTSCGKKKQYVLQS